MRITKNFRVLLLASVTLLTSVTFAQNMRFPQFKDYGLKPSGSKTALVNACIAEYDIYKKFLKTHNGEYYIESKDTDGDKDIVTVSEAHGYGMIIMAIMAGQDPDAKKYFDGMYEFYKTYSSGSLMNWRIWDDWSADYGAATDGDLDIAYALLLASEQWGDSKYENAAYDILDAIFANEINQNTYLPRIDDGGAQAQITRPSDWMAGHFRVFAEYDNGSPWNSCADAVYSTYNDFVSNYSSSTGLISDFVANGAPFSGIETTHDDEYYYNACRVPMRFAMDYARSGNSSAKAALQKIGGWIQEMSGGDVQKIQTGYSLDGDAISTDNSLEFMAPFGAALIATSNQTLLTSIWNEIQQPYYHDATTTSYGEALAMLSMLVMSGNWWKPGDTDTYEEDVIDTNGVVIDNFSDDYYDPSEQTQLGALNGLSWGDAQFGTNAGDTTTQYGGGYWYTYNEGGEVKSSDGTVLGETNMDKIVTNSMLDVSFSVKKDGAKYGYAAVEVPFGGKISKSGDSVKTVDCYYDLSKLSSIVVTYKASAPIRMNIVTEDATGLEWGNYGYTLPAQSSMTKLAVAKADIAAEMDSPLLDSVKANPSKWGWEASGAKAAMSISFMLTEEEDLGASATLQIQEILITGMKYTDFGINYRLPNPQPIVSNFLIKNNNKGWHPIVNNGTIGIKNNFSKGTDYSASLYTLSGKEISSLKGITQKNVIEFKNADISNGIYIIKLKTKGVITTARVSIVK